MIFKIKNYIYPINIIVFLDEDDDVISKKIKSTEIYKITNLTAYTVGRCVILEDVLTILIRLVSQPNKYDMLGTIFHESQHATFFLLDRIGCEYTANSSNESFTYLGTYIFKEICKKIKI